MKNILITGSAGLVGQNLVTRLKKRNDLKIVGIDKHKENNKIFINTHPEINLVEADLSELSGWEKHFEDIDTVIINHAQISSLNKKDFVDNNVVATKNVLEACKKYSINHVILISSSVVFSEANDFYTNTKAEQEKLIDKYEIPFTVLRPTLMFGWFDRKHLGWLSRFLKRSLIFPIPGDGKFIRQPLYVGDFCKIIESCIFNKKVNMRFNISGLEKIYYIDLIKMLKSASKGRSYILKIPYLLFWALLKVYSLFSNNPPFTTSQLEALVIPEEFEIIDWPSIFNINSTSLKSALNETFNDEKYSNIVLKF